MTCWQGEKYIKAQWRYIKISEFSWINLKGWQRIHCLELIQRDFLSCLHLALNSLFFFSFFFFSVQLNSIPAKGEEVFSRPVRNYSTQIRSWDLKLTVGADIISMKIRLNGRCLLAYPWRCTALSMQILLWRQMNFQQIRSSCYKNMNMSRSFYIFWCEGWSPPLNSLP